MHNKITQHFFRNVALPIFDIWLFAWDLAIKSHKRDVTKYVALRISEIEAKNRFIFLFYRSVTYITDKFLKLASQKLLHT